MTLGEERHTGLEIEKSSGMVQELGERETEKQTQKCMKIKKN